MIRANKKVLLISSGGGHWIELLRTGMSITASRRETCVELILVGSERERSRAPVCGDFAQDHLRFGRWAVHLIGERAGDIIARRE